MSPLESALRSLYGAYRLVLFDKSGFSYFDTSISGFWRSFTAAFLISPFFFIIIYMDYNTEKIDLPLSKHMSHGISAYALSWLVFPVLMEHLTKRMGCRDKYISFIVAYNWAMVPQYTVFILLLSLGLIGIIPPELSDSLSVMLLIWTFFYAGFIAKSMLQVSLQTTIGIIIMDFLLGLTIDLTITG
jgi:hypothetical protein